MAAGGERRFAARAPVQERAFDAAARSAAECGRRAAHRLRPRAGRQTLCADADRQRPLHGQLTMRASSFPMTRSRRARGFTLLEVLVALFIVLIALGAALRAVGSLTQNSDGLRSAMMASWSAENRLVQIRLAKEFPAVGKQSFDCPQGDLQLTCEQEVIVSPNPRLGRVEVSVYDQAHPERRIVKLVQLVLSQ